MKQILFTSFFLSLILSFPACKKSHLKRIEIKRTYASDSLEYTHQIDHFDANGNIIKSVSIDKNKKEDIRSYFYDEQNREIESSYIASNPEYSYHTKQLYNEFDSLSLIQIFKKNQSPDFSIQLYYDAQKRNHKDIASYPDGSLKFWDEYTFTLDGQRRDWSRYKADSSLDLHVVYQFDSLNRNIGYIGEGALGGSYQYKLDEDGNKIEELAINTDDQSFLWKVLYEYNSKGKLLEINFYDSTLIDDRFLEFTDRYFYFY